MLISTEITIYLDDLNGSEIEFLLGVEISTGPLKVEIRDIWNESEGGFRITYVPEWHGHLLTAAREAIESDLVGLKYRQLAYDRGMAFDAHMGL